MELNCTFSEEYGSQTRLRGDFLDWLHVTLVLPTTTGKNKLVLMDASQFVVRKTEMPESTQEDVITAVLEATQQYDTEKDVSAYVKKVFDKKYGPTWHCILGHEYARLDTLNGCFI
ncbi:dynein light chain LC8-type [Paragonimus westermani]|uniref:Dynein light chain n=1 Tax=Paragonimus westermani TaxID=34504 RepID=A0A5J4NN24_9TREM|nr:dynein light chain LC8-type [Paragonimus westermani]KAA3672652.1 dynein light chain LC8-type [Paragonimus westermani]KAA3676986.1 dynein light chain LC8-type [Paragonimus westermani]